MLCPLLSVYAASKAFVSHFSKSLYYEYSSNGIYIQHVSPFFVSSKMSKMRASFFTPSAKNFVRSALCSATRLKVRFIYNSKAFVGALNRFCHFLHIVNLIMLKYQKNNFNPLTPKTIEISLRPKTPFGDASLSAYCGDNKGDRIFFMIRDRG